MAVSGNLQIWELNSGAVNSGDLLVACPFGQIAYHSPLESFVGAGLTSGVITSGKIGNEAVLSGNIGSGQIGINHFSSGLLESHYINAYSSVNQYNSGTANTALRMSYDNIISNNGITIRSGNEIVFTKSGLYNVQFSAQFEKTTAGNSDYDVWFSLNSGNISYSNTQYTLAGNNAKQVAALNLLQSITASGQYISINWSSAEQAVRILAAGSQVSPVRPEIPSVILTVWEI